MKTKYSEHSPTVKGSLTLYLISSFTGLDTAVSAHSNNSIISLLVKSYPVKLETSWAVILPPTVCVCSLPNACLSLGTLVAVAIDSSTPNPIEKFKQGILC